MTVKDFTKAVRTRQWAKNALLFGGLIFAGRLRDAGEALGQEVLQVFLAFACFCALSGSAYLINDWMDLENDRRHPIKCNRPLASGRISLNTAKAMLIVLLIAAITCCVVIYGLNARTRYFPIAAGAYFALTLSYSIWLKHEVIVDVLVLATGFVLRVVAGCLAVPVLISPWIVFCTFNLALFISLCKRRAELLELGDAAGTRRVLQGYTQPLLENFISISAGLTIVAYSLYTFNAPHNSALGSLKDTPLLMMTIPFVVFGIFRYLVLAYSSAVGGEPEQMLRDKPLVINVLLWVVLVAILTLLGR